MSLTGLILLWMVLQANAQTPVATGDGTASIDQRLLEMMTGMPPGGPGLTPDGFPPSEILLLLAPYEKDASPHVRAEASRAAMHVSRLAASAEARRDVVGRLLRAAEDPEPLVWQQAFKFLLRFRQDDFDAEVQETIRGLLDRSPPSRDVVRLCGVAGIQEATPRLRALSKQDPSAAGEWFGSVAWAAHLALARLGSGEDTDYCLAAVKAESRDQIRLTRLLDDVAYMRRPSAILYLAEVAQSDEALPRLSDVPSVKHCQYAIDLLAMILEGFPVESTGPGGYSDADVDRCREWLAQQTTWNIIQ